MTKYSYDSKINNGINVLDCVDYVEETKPTQEEPKPIDEPKPSEEPKKDDKNNNEDEELNAFIRLFKKILEYILNLFKQN